MTGVEAFLAELDTQNARALERIAAAAAREPAGDITVPKLLSARAEERARGDRVRGDVDPDDARGRREAGARTAGGGRGEALPAHREASRRAGGDVDAATFETGPRSPLLQYLASLESTVERVAAGQFTREALALVRNDEFMRFCESRDDGATAALYRDVIQPDERHHHELGRKLLARLATDDGAKERARAASTRTLELAEEIQEIARLKMGVSRAPGC